jgi:hypothetical protein
MTTVGQLATYYATLGYQNANQESLEALKEGAIEYGQELWNKREEYLERAKSAANYALSEIKCRNFTLENAKMLNAYNPIAYIWKKLPTEAEVINTCNQEALSIAKAGEVIYSVYKGVTAMQTLNAALDAITNHKESFGAAFNPQSVYHQNNLATVRSAKRQAIFYPLWALHSYLRPTS